MGLYPKTITPVFIFQEKPDAYKRLILFLVPRGKLTQIFLFVVVGKLTIPGRLLRFSVGVVGGRRMTLIGIKVDLLCCLILFSFLLFFLVSLLSLFSLSFFLLLSLLQTRFFLGAGTAVATKRFCTVKSP